MAEGLEAALLQAIGQTDAKNVGLARAYEAAVVELGQEDVVTLLRLRYGDTEPLPWHLLIPRLAWEAVWTLNVDDSIENAYLAVPERRQSAQVRLWQDAQLPYGGGHDDVPLVHLHGYVGTPGGRIDPQLVFKFQEYLGALRQADTGNWQSRFRGDFELMPAIIIGARMSEEIDMVEVIRKGNFSSRFDLPSLLVRPNISDFERSEYERWGLTVVDAHADVFFEYLVAAVEAVAPPASDQFSTRYTDRVLVPLVPRADEYLVPEGHDFYGGHSPTWVDILTSLDAEPQWMQPLLDEIGTPATYADVQRVYLLHGDPFAGKTTALLRLARRLGEQGWEPVLLVGHERIEWNETLQYLASRPNAVLVIDGLAGEANDLGELLRRADAMGQRLLIFGSERHQETGRVKNAVLARYLMGIETTLFVAPTSGLWASILDRRDDFARLGILEGANERDRQLHFVTHRQELFSALATLEDASGFIDRGLQVYRDLPTPLQSAFDVVALLARFGHPCPLNVISMSTSVSTQTVLNELQPQGALAQWVVLDEFEPGLVRLRHRYLGELLVAPQADVTHPIPLRQIAQAICIALEPSMSPKTIRRKTIPHRIVASLMDLENVQALCGTPDVDDWYEKLETSYGWSARFWEQRALGLPDSLDRAFSYAKRAVELHSDAFTTNTLGTVLMRRAVDPAVLSTKQQQRYWQDGLTALARSREHGDGRFEHPFMTFFTYTLRLLTCDPPLDKEWRLRAEQAFADWRAEAERLSFLGNFSLRRIIDDFPHEWR